MRYYSLTFVFGVIFLILSCQTSLKAQATNEEKDQIAVSDISIVKSINSIDTLTFKEELSESGVFGRKIIFRDLSTIKLSSTISGSIAVKVCVDRRGTVRFVELYLDETSITDKQILKSYLKACFHYKFQPDLAAPKEQCGKLLFNINNSSKK